MTRTGTKETSPWFGRSALAVTFLAVVWSALPPRTPADGPDFDAFGRIPVVSGGRLKPMDTVARNALREVSGRTIVHDQDEEGKTTKLSPTAWLAEAVFDSPSSGSRPVILVENEQVKALFDKQETEAKRFSMEDISPASREIERLARKALEKPQGARDTFERQLVALYQRITAVGRLFHSVQPPALRDYKPILDQFPSIVAKAVPETGKMQRGEDYDPEPVRMLSDYLKVFRTVQDLHGFFAVPPKEAGGGPPAWRDAGSVVLEEVARGHPHPHMDAWARIADAYHTIDADNGAAFNAEVDRYLKSLAGADITGMNRAATEWWFNHFEPFYLCLILYVVAFLCVLAGWALGSAGLARAAFLILLVTFVVHTLGLGLRIGLSGRPPVTNLYSSAIFIGWGVLALCLALEKWILRNGIPSAVAALIGFGTLVIAHNLSFDGDTMEVKRAVLDSNFWLATHVVVVTLGYSATFLAGVAAFVWLFLRLARARFFDAAARRALNGSVYGIICFGLLFSFTGTVLGGIWADQSWGRFWGWDPKENGALIIVLWNAIILHARWGGMIRERGMMVLAMGGNIVTAWSWFGTNLLGIGLHSYGFTEKGFTYLVAWVVLNLLLMAAAALVPGEEKKRNKEPPKPTGDASPATGS